VSPVNTPQVFSAVEHLTDEELKLGILAEGDSSSPRARYEALRRVLSGCVQARVGRGRLVGGAFGAAVRAGAAARELRRPRSDTQAHLFVVRSSESDVAGREKGKRASAPTGPRECSGIADARTHDLGIRRPEVRRPGVSTLLRCYAVLARARLTPSRRDPALPVTSRSARAEK
jgi:hypothetical protein